MDIAQRDDERLAIDVLIRIPSVKTLEEAADQARKPALREAAAKAAVAIAEKLVANQSAAVAKSMQKVIDWGIGDPLRANAKQLLDQAKAAMHSSRRQDSYARRPQAGIRLGRPLWRSDYTSSAT